MKIESPDTIHGRMKEGAHLAGYGLQRTMENLRWLLEDQRYKKLSPGYAHVNEFLRDTAEAFTLLKIDPTERKEIAKLIKEAEPQASQRAIADMVGVSQPTIRKDLGIDNHLSLPATENPEIDNYLSPAITPDDFDPVAYMRDRPHVTNNSGDNEWYTPPQYIEAARKVMGEIELDPASSALANQTVKAKWFFTKEMNGLNEDWLGKVWMNPPYAQPEIGQFSEKLAKEYSAGKVNEAVVLVNNATETNWFQTLLKNCAAVCFLRGRVKFLDLDGNPTGGPLQGQSILYLGENVKSFTVEFSKFGKVLYV